MAEIPVEKKSSMSWLWWLLLLAGIIALLWAIFDNDDDTPDLLDGDDTAIVGDADVNAVDADADIDGNIQTLTGVAALGSLATMIGTDVDLSGVAVNRVIGDESFTVGEGANETLVRFDEVQTPNTAREGLVDVNPGSRVRITGSVEALDMSDMPETVRTDLAGGNQAYIRASSVDVVNGGETP